MALFWSFFTRWIGECFLIYHSVHILRAIFTELPLYALHFRNICNFNWTDKFLEKKENLNWKLFLNPQRWYNMIFKYNLMDRVVSILFIFIEWFWLLNDNLLKKDTFKGWHDHLSFSFYFWQTSCDIVVIVSLETASLVRN